MKVDFCVTTPLQTNTYIVSENGKGFVVDPGGDWELLKKKIVELNIEIEAVLLTHGHFDHTNAALFFQNEGAKVFCHRDDCDKLKTYKGLAFSAGIHHNKLTPDIALVGGESLKIAGMTVKVIHTPGHSKGSVCYLVDDLIFCGDTLFYMLFGRTDFFDGSFSEIKNSIFNKLFNLKGDFKLYTGHGEFSTLDFERKNNEINFIKS